MQKRSGQQGGGDADKRATGEAMGLTAWRGLDDCLPQVFQRSRGSLEDRGEGGRGRLESKEEQFLLESLPPF